MQVNRRMEPCGRGVKTVKPAVVGVGGSRAAVQHRSSKTELGNGSLQFLSGAAGLRRRDGRESLKSRRVAIDDSGERVIGFTGDGDGIRWCEVLHPRRGQ